MIQTLQQLAYSQDHRAVEQRSEGPDLYFPSLCPDMSPIILNHSKQFKNLLWKCSNKCYNCRKTFAIDALQEDTLQHISKWYANYNIFEALDYFSRTWTIKDIQSMHQTVWFSLLLYLTLWPLRLVVECPHNHQSVIDYINLLFLLLFFFILPFPLATLL